MPPLNRPRANPPREPPRRHCSSSTRPTRSAPLRCAVDDDPGLALFERIVRHYGQDPDTFPVPRDNRVVLTSRRLTSLPRADGRCRRIHQRRCDQVAFHPVRTATGRSVAAACTPAPGAVERSALLRRIRLRGSATADLHGYGARALPVNQRGLSHAERVYVCHHQRRASAGHVLRPRRCLHAR